MKHALIIMGLIFSCVPLLSHYADSEEGRWRLFGKSVTETLWYMDTETVTYPKDNVVAVWVKSIPDKNHAVPAEETDKTEVILKSIQEKYFGDYEYTDGLWELDCSQSLFRLLYFCAYDKHGDILTSRVTPDAEWASILPGSAGEALRETVCPPPSSPNPDSS